MKNDKLLIKISEIESIKNILEAGRKEPLSKWTNKDMGNILEKVIVALKEIDGLLTQISINQAETDRKFGILAKYLMSKDKKIKNEEVLKQWTK